MIAAASSSPAASTTTTALSPGPNDTYKRSTVRLKASQLIGDKFKVGGNLSYIDTRGSFIQRGDNTSGIMLGGLRTPPEWNNLDFIASNGQYKTYRFQTPSTPPPR